MTEGLNYLDTYVPGWPNMVDLDTLSMESTAQCVVAQIMEGQWFCDSARALMDLSDGAPDYSCEYSWAVDHGFDNVREAGPGVADRLWREAIARRRAQAA